MFLPNSGKLFANVQL